MMMSIIVKTVQIIWRMKMNNGFMVRCDSCGEEAPIPADHVDSPSVIEDMDWQVADDGTHYCPDCYMTEEIDTSEPRYSEHW